MSNKNNDASDTEQQEQPQEIVEEPVKRRRRMSPENLEKLKFARECVARKKLELSTLQNKAKELNMAPKRK